MDARRTGLNDELRGGLTGLEGYFDVADAIETSRNSGIWKVTGSANGYTADGIHPNTPGSVLVRDSGVIALPVVMSSKAGAVTQAEPSVGAGVLTSKAGRVGTAQVGVGDGDLTSTAGPVQ